MILTFTDFGVAGPYLGQMRAAVLREAPRVPVIDLFADLPPFNARGAAYLLAAYAPEFPSGSVFLCVVDPGVGSERPPVALEAEGRWFVGPGNGLFEIVARRSGRKVRWWDIVGLPDRLSASFHGRDLFAPVAARIARGEDPETSGLRRSEGAATGYPDWPDDLAEVVYVDSFGNLMTGIRAESLENEVRLSLGGRTLDRERTFSDVPAGQAFWYENANGLVEIAVNQGRADQALAVGPGTAVVVEKM